MYVCYQQTRVKFLSTLSTDNVSDSHSQYVPPKRWCLPTTAHDAKTQKTNHLHHRYNIKSETVRMLQPAYEIKVSLTVNYE